MTLDELIGCNEAEHAAFKRRIDALETEAKVHGEIRITLERLNQTIIHMTQTLGKLEARLDALEKAPVKRWQLIVSETIKYVLLLALGALAAKII